VAETTEIEMVEEMIEDPGGETMTAGLVRKERGDHVVPWTTTMTGTVVDHPDVISVATALATAITVDVMIDLAGTGTAEVAVGLDAIEADSVATAIEIVVVSIETIVSDVMHPAIVVLIADPVTLKDPHHVALIATETMVAVGDVALPPLNSNRVDNVKT